MARLLLRQPSSIWIWRFVITFVALNMVIWPAVRELSFISRQPLDDPLIISDYSYPPGPRDVLSMTTTDTAAYADVSEDPDTPIPVTRSDSPKKTILFWTSFYEKTDFYFGFGQRPFLQNYCPINNCETTTDKTRLNESHAVLFHGPRVEELEALPVYRPPGQIYIMFQAEPQYYPSVAYLHLYNSTFNYTMATKRDADAFIAYGKAIPSSYGQRIRKGVVVNPKLRPKSVVWMVSHCETHGHREWYVEELAKNIDIDVYGACGPLSCPIGDPCLSRFEMEYKFYLALENSYCQDYVTEKMYRTLTFDIIPIVFGGANYTLDAPPHSVINILDFPHPKDLADYLVYLSNNITAYDEYFEWKRHYVIQHFRHKLFGQAFCKLCEDLNNPDFEYKDYTNIASWWLDGLCDYDVMPKLRRKYLW